MGTLTIKADTLDNMYQLSLVEETDILGAKTYSIIVIKDSKEIQKITVEDKDIALGVYDGSINYYNTLH